MSAQEQSACLSRPESARRANERIASRAERLHFLSRVPMLCECSDAACEALFLIALDLYHRERGDHGSFFTAPDHGLDGAEPRRKEPDYWLQERRLHDRMRLLGDTPA